MHRLLFRAKSGAETQDRTAEERREERRRTPRDFYSFSRRSSAFLASHGGYSSQWMVGMLRLW